MSEKPPIDGSGTNPYPPPPDGWEPQQLTQDLISALDRAALEVVERFAQTRGVSMRKAVPLVIEALRDMK